MDYIAQWLNVHGMPNVKAQKTGKAALRISVPVLDQHKPFEDASQEDVKACFDAVQQLSRSCAYAFEGGIFRENKIEKPP